MLEYFEKIWFKNPKAEDVEIEKLYQWLQDNKFPSCYLPKEYLDLMEECNGGDFTNGEREYQLLSMEEVMEYYEAYQFATYMPYAFPFAMDGCGNFYLFNLRWEDSKVYTVHAGDMGWEEDEYLKIAESFIECLGQKVTLDDLR